MSPETTNPSVSTLRPGDKLDKFEIVAQIGAGGMGSVWKGYDRLLDRAVAIKQVTIKSATAQEQEQLLERFRQEIEIQKRAGQAHKNLVKVVACVQDPRGLFLVMEYVDGPTLAQYLEAHPQALDPRQVLGIIGGAAMALEALHREGVVHRDLTPSNIFLPTAGGLKIGDFGLATLLDQQEVQAVGSARYMAPESFESQAVDGRADIYSLGMIAYEMLAGKAAFAEAFKVVLRDTRNQALRWMKWHTNARASAPALNQLEPKIPKKLSDLVARMMEKDPAQRIASADELLGAIRRHFSGASDSESRDPVMDRGRVAALGAGVGAEPTAPLPPRSRLPLYLGLSAAGLLLVMVGALLFSYLRKTAEYDKAHEAAVREFVKALDKQNRADDASINPAHELSAKEAEFETASYLAAIGDFEHVAQAWSVRDPANLGRPSEAHRLWCQAMVKMLAKDYAGAKGLFVQADALGILDRNRIQERIDDAAFRMAVADQLASIIKLKDAGNLHDAQAGLEKLRNNRDLMLDSERERMQTLASQIDAAESDSEVSAVISAAAELYDRGQRQQAIKDLTIANSKRPHDRYTHQIDEWKHTIDLEKTATTLTSAERENRYDDAMAAIKHLRSILTPAELVQFNNRAGKSLDRRERDVQIAQFAAEAKSLTDAGHPDQASAMWAKVLALDPNNKPAHDAIGSIDDEQKVHQLVAMGDSDREAHNWPDALAKYKDALKVRPDPAISAKIDACQVEWDLQQGLDNLANGHPDEARHFFEQVLAKNPDQEVAKKNLAEIDRRTGIEQRIAHADVLVKAGQYGDAANLLDKVAHELLPEDSSFKQQVQQRRDQIDYLSWLHKARLAIDAGDWKGAAQYLETLQATPNGHTPEVDSLVKKVQPHLQTAQPDTP